MLTPYAGIGRVWIDSSPNVSTLSSESFQQNKFYVGANLNLALITLALEYDHTGDDNTYGAKLGLRFCADARGIPRNPPVAILDATIHIATYRPAHLTCCFFFGFLWCVFFCCCCVCWCCLCFCCC